MKKDYINLLLIEDNPGDARLIKEYLQAQNSPNIFITWVDRLGKIVDQANELIFDVILLDLNLPDSSGLETVERTITLVPDIPIVVLTGIDDDQLTEKIIQVGAQDYLSKSAINTELLLHSIKYASDRHVFIRRIKESHEQFLYLIENVFDGVLIIDQFGIVNYLNPAFEKMLKLPRHEILNKPFGFPFSKDGFEEITINDNDESPLIAEMRLSEIIWEGELCHLAVLRDITARKEMEARIKEYSRKMEKLNHDKDKFFSIIAHDLRSPFNAFLGLSEMMKEGIENFSQDELVTMVTSLNKSANNLATLLDNLFEWSHQQQGKTDFSPVDFDLAPQIAQLISLADEMITNKQLHIQFKLQDDLVIHADLHMFNTIVRNLVFNAIKFTPRGGSVTIAAKRHSKERGVISVADTGIGMPAELVENLFNIGYKTNRKGTEGEASTGLGLILCKEYVEKNDGNIWVESLEGVGSVFSFTIPIMIGVTA
ncbi:MAG: response regulator [Bacteroidales bacterium]|nr:response regulator [Bacteroidales bacterium]